MNKFTQHIPNYCDGFEPEIFEFTDLDDLANKLGKDKSSLVFDDEHILSVSKDGTQWRRWSAGGCPDLHAQPSACVDQAR